MRQTHEQQAIIDSDSPFLRAEAFAGSGKTTTMVGYADARPRLKMLTIAFSKAVQMEAKKKFPSNVHCVTSHGMAFPKFGSIYANADKLVTKLRVNEVAAALPLDDYPDEFKYFMADICLKTLARFFATEHEEINEQLVEGLLLPGTPAHASDVVNLSTLLWNRMQDPEDKEVGMLHDGYLKLYQLSRPQLNYDVILFDEAQDANPVTASIIEAQQCNKVVVGDSHQAIFNFRLATNAMQKFKADTTLYLTQSFRFGQEIADVANFLLLNYKGEKRPLIGNAQRGRIGIISAQEPCAVIARGNATLFYEAISALKRGKSVHFVGGIDGYRMTDMMDAHNLWSGNLRNIKNPYLRAFGKFESMEEFAVAAEDRELKSLVNIVQRYGSKIPALVSSVRGNATEDSMKAHIHLTTAHKSKGLEWNNVRLADDYIDLLDKFGRPCKIDFSKEEEINILYVASTRAKKTLQPFQDMQTILDERKKAMKTDAPKGRDALPEWARSVVTKRA